MASEFEWETDGGVKIKLPRIKSGVLRKHRRRPEVDFVYSVMEEVLDEKTLAQTDELDDTELGEMFEAWMGSATPGESSPSST